MMSTGEQAPLEVMIILQLTGFATGVLGCILLPITAHHSDWRLWVIEESDHDKPPTVHFGIWKICFLPNLMNTDEYALRCCHDFDLFEKFFPIELKVGQLLTFIASFLAFWGLVFAFLIPWIYSQKRIQIRWLPFIGGFFCLMSSICVFVSISWSVYSVFRNESVHFPTSFHLPSQPFQQKNGGAIYLGYLTGTLLFLSGFCIVFHVSLMSRIPVRFRSSRVIPV